MNCCVKIIRFVLIYICAIPGAILLRPIGSIFDFFTITHPDLFRPTNNPTRHKIKVEKVQAQVRQWNTKGRKKRMCTATPGWQTLSFRHLNKTKFQKIRIGMEDIIEVDTKKDVRVEPGMKMGTLTYKLLSRGWTIPVIPEFRSLTVGGLVNGTGIETSSHKHGLFADTCTEFEIVLADGSVVNCSKDVNSDLFYSISWSHGTLGFLTSVTIPIQPARQYVKLEYHPTDSFDAAQILLQENKADFVEGMMFSQNEFVIMHGNLADSPHSKNEINNINRWYKPWFFKHVESKVKHGIPSVEYIPLRDYYHRHERGYFWENQIPFPYGNSMPIRYFFGWIFPYNYQLLKILHSDWLIDTMSNFEKHFLQDFMIPMNKLKEALQIVHDTAKVYPLWLCPVKFFSTPGLAPAADGDESYIDIGIYGITNNKNKNFNIEKAIQKLEKMATDFKGYQFLYADSYMTREEFSNMFYMINYNEVRQKYDCEGAFPEIYDKVSRRARHGSRSCC